MSSKVAEITVNTPSAASLESQLRQRFNVVEQRLEIGRFSFQLLHPRSADELIDDEAFNRDERLPYWAEIWPSAYVLARRIAEDTPWRQEEDEAITVLSSPKAADDLRRYNRQPRLLELGCGCGLAVSAALAAGFLVTAVDYYSEALEFVQLNASLNRLPLPETRVVDWRDYPADLIDFDMVVAADVLYERDYCRLIADAFQHSLRPGGIGLLTDPQRTKAEPFPNECRRAALQASSPQVFGPLSVPNGDPGVRQTVNFFELRKAQE